MMVENDLSPYQWPISLAVRHLSEGGFVTQALDEIRFLLEKGEVDEFQRRRLLLESHRLSVLQAQYPYEWNQATLLAKEKGITLKKSMLHALPWVLIDGVPHLHKRFLQTILKGAPTEEKLHDLQLRDLVREKMSLYGHAEARISVHVGLKLKPEAYRKGKMLDVELPIPVQNSFMSDLNIVAQSGQLVNMSPLSSRRRVARFRGFAKADEEFWVEYSFTNKQIYHHMEELEKSCFQKKMHQKDEPPYIVGTKYIASLANKIVGKETNPIRKARLIYKWVTSNISYSYMPSYQTIANLAEYGLANRIGDCGVQAAIFINLLRQAGIRSGFMGGMYVTDTSVSNHDWATFEVPGLPYTFYADCSFGGGALLKGNTELSDFYFGNLDVMRLPCTTLLAPGPELVCGPWRNDPTDNQRGEAWYGNVTVPWDQIIDTRKTISFKLL